MISLLPRYQGTPYMSRMDHRSQVLKGVLDMCLLSLISEEPSYGYEMASKLSHRGLDLVSEGSIYRPPLAYAALRSHRGVLC